MNANETLKVYFGYDTFRDGQEDIINAILSGRDVLAIMPTGAGKSICYQVPALMMSGITIVISPLISLMQDQVKALNEAGVHAAYINSSLTENQINKALSLAAQGRYKIIYVAPERLTSYTFLDFACHAEISMVTVDEAHCISQWGQDFRPSYLKIVEFVARLPRRPIVSAFTATATEDVKNDIIHILKLEQPKVVVTGFDRENLYYSVERIRRKDDFVLEYIHNHPQESGIIYCATRKNVDKLFELLFKSGVAVTRYHAGLDNETRKKNQEDFIYDRAPIVVATNAFGMGIDKSNVRYVIHYNMPQSMENYYQEAGRAGRDGEAAQCILLFSEQDMVINRFLLEQKDFSEMDIEDARLVMERDVWRLQVMERYCKTSECLRNYILSYFGEQPEHPCGHCGNCQKDYQEIDMTGEATWVLRSVEEAQGRYGIAIIAGVLMGANRARLKELGMTEYASYGALKNLSEARIRELINLMITEGYLYQTKAQYSVLRIGDIGPLLNDDAQIILKVDRQETEPEKKSKSAKAMRKKVAGELTSQGSELFELLRKLRTEIASEEGVPPYIIFSDKTLIDMCIKLPENEEQFLDVSGVGAHKLEKYGDKFLRVIREFKEGL
jgi:ATP-dependent DNA helicase RecQ